MTSRRWLWKAPSLASLVLVISCTSVSSPDLINPTATADLVKPSAGYFAWRLPKTVLDVAVVYTFRGCKSARGKLDLKVDAAVNVIPRGVPDDNIFGNPEKGAWVTLPMSKLQSFWQDRELTIRHNVDGTLASINAKAIDNSAAIVGGALTSIAKDIAVIQGVPAGASGGDSVAVDCDSSTLRKSARIDVLRQEIKADPTLTVQQLAVKTSEIQDLTKAMTITQNLTISPPVSSVDEDNPSQPPPGLALEDLIAVVYPDQKRINQWVTGTAVDTSSLKISVYLDFGAAWPAIIRHCETSNGKCVRHATHIDQETHFREPALIPVRVFRGGSTALAVNGFQEGMATPFAQYGLPRSVPIDAGVFQKLSMNVGFDEFGRSNDVTFTSGASGTQAGALFTSASNAANSIAVEGRSDPETIKAQAELARLKALSDLATVRQQYLKLQAQGLVP